MPDRRKEAMKYREEFNAALLGALSFEDRQDFEEAAWARVGS
jgi:hypothetical protein